MCPDRQILSLYADGELPSPWKEKLETHLASCPDCGSRLGEYRGLSRALGEAEDGGFRRHLETAQGRVWGRIAAARGRNRPQLRRGRIWSRRVSFPLPAVAAAALIFTIALAAVLRISRSGPSPDSMTTAALGLDVQGISPVTDLRGVLQYLEDGDAGDILIIRLPESKNFASFGEPTIIRAADYTKGAPRRSEGPAILPGTGGAAGPGSRLSP